MNVRIALRRVASAVESREDEIVEAMITRNVAEVPDLGLAGEEPAVLEAYRASARANLRAGLATLSADGPLSGHAPPAVELPLEAAREARESVRARVPLEALLRTYRIGHSVALEALIEEVEHAAEDSTQRQMILRLLNRYAFAYIDAVLPLVTREYEAERRRQSRRREQRRLDAVLAILDGAAADTTELDYELRGWHLALIAWGGDVEAAAVAVGRELQRPALSVKVGDGTVWCWLGGRRKFGPETWQLVDSVRIPDGTSLSIGEGARGVEGFRRTHRMARDAQRIGLALRNRLTRYSEVAVEALALRDPAAARIFVEHLLGPLKQARNSDKLQKTLAAYLRCGLNASATASSIGVNDRTVAYRLKLIEELAGQPLATMWFQLEAALRLERVLPANPGTIATSRRDTAAYE